MKKSNSNKYLVIAFSLSFIYLGIGHFVPLPDIIEGFCVGISIAMYIVGLYAMNHDMSRLQSYKKKLVSKFVP